MILIADSGSTKTDWRIIDNAGNIEQLRCAGLNPYYQNEEGIYAELNNVLKPQLKPGITKVYFYGAGCSADKKKVMESALTKTFPEAELHINHDLLAAARALCGQEPGIAGILGTGSNSCLFDGNEIIDNIPTLGLILGDEGSGAVLGKKIVTAYLRKRLPAHLMEKFDKRYRIDYHDVLDHVYKQPYPSRYLAAFSRFMLHNIRDPFVYRMVYENFEAFFDAHILQYKNYQQYKVHFVGSVAFYYSNILRQVANDKGVVLKNILETPIAGLTLYHQKNG